MFKTLLALGVISVVAQPVHAQSLGQGIERIAVDDGLPSVCINALTDHVSVRLDRVVVEKSKGWFTSDEAVDLVIDGKIEKRNANFETSQAKMPIVFRANIDEYHEGTVVTPVSIVLMSKYPLTLGGSTVNLLELDFSFINSSSPTLLTRLISRLPAAAQGLPIPPTPYSQAFVKASSVLGGVVDSILQDDDSKDDVTREGRIPLEFNETGQCGRNGAYSGTYTFIKEFEADAQPGVIKLDDIQNQCFIKFNNTNAIFVEKKGANGACTYAPANVSRLLNPHFTMIVSITNTGPEPTQDRQVLSSGLAVATAAAQPGGRLPAGVFDATAISRAFTAASLNVPADGYSGSLYQLEGGAIEYTPDAATTSVEKFNFPQFLLDSKSVSSSFIGTQSIDSEEIILNSISRCGAYGVDVLECF